MNTKQTEALKLALEALKQIDDAMPFPVAKLAQKVIREALAEQQSGIKQVIELYDSPEQPAQLQEPIGWEYVVQLLIAAGHVSQEKVDHACAIAKAQQQEPVAWMYEHDGMVHDAANPPIFAMNRWKTPVGEPYTETPLYTSPPASKPWVGLTPAEVHDIWCYNHTPQEVCDAVSAKLREKNAAPCKPDFKAFMEWANASGYDTAHTNDGIKWICLNPMTADLWKAWQAAHGIKGDA